MKKYLFILLAIMLNTPFANAELPTEKTLQTQIDALQKVEQTDEVKASLKTLEDTQTLLSQIAKQKADNDALNNEIDHAKENLVKSQDNLTKLKNSSVNTASFNRMSIEDLQELLSTKQDALNDMQSDIAAVNAKLATQNAVPDKAQAALSNNVTRKQAVNSALLNANISDEKKENLTTELALLDLQNTYNQTLLRGNEDLSTFYNSQLEEKKLQQQHLQDELTAIQQVISEKMVADSKVKVEQANQSLEKNVNAESNPIIVRALDANAKLSQELLEQTTKMNELSQENLRIKGVLDNLQQTQHNLEEQISSLQGSLVLSRIINKQRASLPQDEMIKGLADRINDLRVNIFDFTEFKDKIADPKSYIAKLEKEEKTTFTDDEKVQLTDILSARSKTFAELIKSLNSQLNLAINIELSQQQVQTISDELQQKLQQQSFWVKSNNPIDLAWFAKLGPTLSFQLDEIRKQFDFSNWRDNVVPASLLIGGLLLATLIILRQKEKIKRQLTQINNSMKSVETDSQWNTPKAIFLTTILCLPSTFLFLTVFILVTYICFQDPLPIWPWGLKMAVYWFCFAFMLAILRPHGIGYTHFDMPQKSNELFYNILKRSVWVIGLLLNTSIFANVETGITYDVLGEIMTITVLVMTVFIIAPGFRKAISTYQHTAEDIHAPKGALTFVRLVLLLAPIALIVLIVMGYYYTSLVIIEHLISTYFAVTTWIIIRNICYRGFSVTSRRLAHRRLQEKKEQHLAKQASGEQAHNLAEDEVAIEIKHDEIAVSEIKNQMLKVTDFVLWIGLFAALYWVWSDLITVAYYLKGVTLWQQSVTSDTGAVAMESITLLNLLVAIVIVVVTYVLIKNLSGLLETFVFPHLSLSQGTPYTITTLLTYLLIVLGAAFAFSTLGMSWSKLQWLFTALSVGLGFGMQEIFGNFVSGIIILFERPVRVGDMVTIGNFNGTVSKIRIRATTLIDYDKKEVIVPNKAFITERVVNWALTNSMTRLVISVGVAYGSDLELVRKLLLQAAEENPSVLKDPAPAAYFLSFGASTLDHELRIYVGQLSERTRTIDQLNRRINELFAENGIDIAFNQLDIFIKNQATNEEVKWATEDLTNKI